MSIDASDRAALLGTENLQVQVERILKQQPDGRDSLSHLREIYRDLSEGRFRSLVYSMQAKGHVRLEDGDVVLVRESVPRGYVADKVWKAMKMLGVFTCSDVANLLPDARPSVIRGFLTRWEKDGSIVRIESSGEETWSVAKRRILRPRFKVERGRDESMSAVIIAGAMSAVDSFGRRMWTVEMLAEALGDPQALSLPFLEHLLHSWEAMGAIRRIGDDGRRRRYSTDRERFRRLVMKGGQNGGKR